MIKELVKDEAKLSIRAKEFDVRKDQDKSIELVQDLCDTLKELPDRLYLTANQIGHEERAFAIKFNDETEVFMNPSIQAKDRMIIFREKDPLTGQEYLVPRYTSIALVFQDCLGSVKGLKFNEAASIIISQAIDAINGILVSDYGLPILPEFDEATKEEQAELIEQYVNSLSNAYKQLDEELSTDEDTKDIWSNAKFVKGLADGDISLEETNMSNRQKKRIASIVDDMKKNKNKLKFWRK